MEKEKSRQEMAEEVRKNRSKQNVRKSKMGALENVVIEKINNKMLFLHAGQIHRSSD